jgi:phosphotransferase system enzyme I (PtsI)
MKRKSLVLHGKKISGGIAVGRARIRLDDLSVVPSYRLTNEAEVEAEIVSFRQAIEGAEREATEDLDWARGNLPELEAEIFAAQRSILADPSLHEWVETRVRDHRENAAQAVRRRFDELRAILGESTSEVIRSRTHDITDAERLIQAHLLGQPRHRPSANGPEEPSGPATILVTHTPPPSLLARIDPRTVAGLACEGGGRMGHVAVLARALNLPALIQVEGLLRGVREGDLVAIEADDERIVVNPEEDELEAIRARERKRKLLLPPAPTDPRAQRRTADGKRIFLLGNVASARDVDSAAQIDADGIGLYRTEYLYLSRNRMPTEAELVATYSAVAVSFTKDPIDVRLLDVGSEKHLHGTPSLDEANPALGLRSMRFLFANRPILETQVRAILQAAAEGPLRLLLPMVTDPDDVWRVREVVSRAHEALRAEGVRHNPDLAVGAMIEHPAGVTMADEICREADFVSVGTNDLTMYLLAVDRDAPHLADYYDPLHPAVIRVLRDLVHIAERQGKPLSVCGEMAGDPSLTGFLVGLGVTRLSMAPQWILPVGLMLASIDSLAWSTLAERAARASTAAQVRKLLREFQESF